MGLFPADGAAHIEAPLEQNRLNRQGDQVRSPPFNHLDQEIVVGRFAHHNDCFVSTVVMEPFEKVAFLSREQIQINQDAVELITFELAKDSSDRLAGDRLVSKLACQIGKISARIGRQVANEQFIGLRNHQMGPLDDKT